MLLKDKTAIVYGAAGPVGSAVARAFAREGARVFLVGRTRSRLELVAEEIHAERGDVDVADVDVAEVDVTDRTAVIDHANAAAATSGRIDVAFNATGNDDVQGMSLTEMALDDVLRPVVKAVTTQLAITTAVAPHMTRTGGGVILAMAGGREAIPGLGGSHLAWSALAGLCRQSASELGMNGIRVVWLLSPGSPEEARSSGVDPDAPSGALISRRPSYANVGNTAAFLASDWAASMTATEVNLTAGAVVD